LYFINIKLDPAVAMRGLVARLLYIPTRKEEIGVIVLCHIGGRVVNRVEWPGELKIEGRVEVWEITPKNTPKKGPEVGDKPQVNWPTLVYCY
jgi:hypothetical protein